MLARKQRRLSAEVSLHVRADEDVGEYFNDNVFKDEAAPGALPKMVSLHDARRSVRFRIHDEHACSCGGGEDAAVFR